MALACYLHPLFTFVLISFHDISWDLNRKWWWWLEMAVAIPTLMKRASLILFCMIHVSVLQMRLLSRSQRMCDEAEICCLLLQPFSWVLSSGCSETAGTMLSALSVFSGVICPWFYCLSGTGNYIDTLFQSGRRACINRSPLWFLNIF